MKYTTNKNLRLPEYDDVVDIADINYNTQIMDEHIAERVDSDSGAHEMRKTGNNTLQFRVGDEWVDAPYVKEVVQGTGNSTTAVMSQKAVTDLIGDIENVVNSINAIIG